MMDKTKNNLLILCRFLDIIIFKKLFGMYDCACFPFQIRFLVIFFLGRWIMESRLERGWDIPSLCTESDGIKNLAANKGGVVIKTAPPSFLILFLRFCDKCPNQPEYDCR